MYVGGREGELGALTWSGSFSQLTHVGQLNTLPSTAVSRKNGGPVLAFDQQSFRSLVISPFDNFLATSMSTTTGSPAPRPAPPHGGPKWTCPASGGCAAVKENTDVTGNPKVDLGHKYNLTRAQCCALCTAHGKNCEAWARARAQNVDP